MKQLAIIFLMIISTLNAFTQSLTIDETIDYINKALSEHPRKADDGQYSYNVANHYGDGKTLNNCWEQINLSSDGEMTIFFCYDFTNYTGFKTNKKMYFNIEDIDIDFLKENTQSPISKSSTKVGLVCKNREECISTTNFYYDLNPKFFTKKYDDLPEPSNDAYYQKKVSNAYKYLFFKIMENGTYHRKDGDPFAPGNISDRNLNDVSIASPVNGKIALSKLENLFTLNVKIGQATKRFILDSGASEMNITEQMEKQLIAEGIIAKEDYLINGLFKTASGDIQECRRVKLKKVTVGTFTALNVTAAIGSDNSPLLLGKSFLDKFKKWSIDNENSFLVLEK